VDALKQSEVWLRKLADDDIDQNPKFQKFLKLIRSHDELMKAHKWLSAHDEIEKAFAQFVEITNQIMVKAKESYDSRTKREKSVNELFETYRAPLKQILKATQAISDNASGMLNNIDHAAER
jgi:hypothetical protein